MWRAFASTFVNHTFDTYIKQSDRSETAPIAKTRRKIDLKNLFPYNHSQEEIEKRAKIFSDLKRKVEKQRTEIKSRDEKNMIEKISKAEAIAVRRIKTREGQRYSSSRSDISRPKRSSGSLPATTTNMRFKETNEKDDPTSIFALTTSNIPQPLGLSKKNSERSSYQGKALDMLRNKDPQVKNILRNELKNYWNDKN